jgi:plasmid stabilization system protein ParE
VNLQIIQEAQDELNEAIAYYEEIQTGLGVRLKEEARGAIRWICDNPDLPRLRPKGYRRVNLRVFPYYIAYFNRVDTIWIPAIAHSHRHPDYWTSRKNKIT